MKKFLSRWLLIIIGVFSMNTLNAKQADLLDLLFNDEVEVAIKPRTKKNTHTQDDKEQNSIAVGNFSLVDFNRSVTESEVDTTDDISEESEIDLDNSSTGQSPCSLLDLLFEDTKDVSTLFPNKNEKYYRGQFEVMGLHYIDNSIYDDQMPSVIRSACSLDQEQLSPGEKEVIEKYYRLTKQKYESPWYMKFISKKIGYGIFAAADIEPGQLIAEYVGIIYDEQSYLNKVPRNSKYCWNVQPPSFLPGNKKFFIDAIESCNFTRIINHSYKPNVIPMTMHGPEGSRMLYVACEKIRKDEQLLVNYGPGYWQTLGEPEELSR